VAPFGWIVRLLVLVTAGALLVTSSVVAIAPRVWRVANAHEQLPVELPEFQSLAQRTYVYDMDGNEIAIYELENSQPISLDEVPEHVSSAFLAVEDNEFWRHDGVNVRSLFRATLSNFASDAPQQGASTITMQVVKNDFLAGLERDGRYKLLQIVYAQRLEKRQTKAEILERYLNTVFFGNNAYGIAAAAETYFGKRVAQLTFVEAAFLAGLVRSPSGYDPISNPDRSRARFRQVVDRLVEDELISPEEGEALLDGPNQFVIPERTQTLPDRSVARTYFTEAVRDVLLNRSTILGDTYQERYSRLFRGGLRIHTTLNQYLQIQAEQARDQLPDTLEGFDAALVSLDTSTSAVRAMVGGRGFIPGQREVNLALAPSQTGSAIKLFILAAALQAGAEAGDILDGTRGCRLPNPGNTLEPEFVIEGGVAGGVFSLREHSYRSINCAFARLSQIVGLDRTVDTTYRMSESLYLYRGQPRSERRPIEPFASFATGANELSTLDMAAGMQTIANEGVHHEPYYIQYIEDAEGRRIYTHSSPGTRVLDVGVAATTIDVLKDTLTLGTGRSELSGFAAQRPAAGKTGTQQSNTTAMFVGSTPFLTTAVLVRDPDRYTPMVSIPEFAAEGVSRVQGGTYPARIWGVFMERAHIFEPVTDWAAVPAPIRGPARLYLPGNECVFVTVRAVVDEEIIEADSERGGAEPSGQQVIEGQRGPGQQSTSIDATSSDTTIADTTVPETTTTTTPETTTSTTTTAPPPVVVQLESDTTVPEGLIDPYAPLPSVPLSASVAPCR
jgi:membrane peptidoglycan carboxypeptidase